MFSRIDIMLHGITFDTPILLKTDYLKESFSYKSTNIFKKCGVYVVNIKRETTFKFWFGKNKLLLLSIYKNVIYCSVSRIQ